MSSQTSNLGLTKPAKGDFDWGPTINTNFDLLDAAYGNYQSTADSLPEVYIYSNTFNGPTGRTITLPKSVDATNEYAVKITATSRGSAIGDIYISKTTTNFVVKCSESNTTDTFTALVIYIGDVSNYGGSIYRKWYVSPDTSITDHGDTSQTGSLAWIQSQLSGTQATVELPGNKTYSFLQSFALASNIELVFQNGAILDTDITIRDSNYQWTLSGSGTSEYYLEASGGGDPGVNEPYVVLEDEVQMTSGSVGSLAAGEWDWGNNDSLGFNTVYVRLSDSTDPDSKSADYVLAGYHITFNGISKIGYHQHVFSGFGVITFGNSCVKTAYPEWFGGAGDNSTDNHLPIERCVNSGAGNVVLTDGIYLTTDAISWASDVELEIFAGATLKLADGATGNIKMLDSGDTQLSRVSFKGPGTIDGNSGSTSATKAFGIFMKAANIYVGGGLKIKNIKTDALSWGDAVCIEYDGATHNDKIIVDDLFVENIGRNGVAALDGTDINISNITYDTLGYGAVLVEPSSGSVERVNIQNVTGTGASGALTIGVIAGDSIDPIGHVNINNINLDTSGAVGVYLKKIKQVNLNNFNLEDIGSIGIYCWVGGASQIAKNVNISNGNVIDTGSHGIFVTGDASVDATQVHLDNLNISEAGDASSEYGIYAYYCNHIDMNNVNVDQSASSGIMFSQVEYARLRGINSFNNGVVEAAFGIRFGNCGTVDIDKITAYDGSNGVQNYGVYMDTLTTVFWGNHINLAGNVTDNAYISTITTIHGRQDMVQVYTGTLAAGTDVEIPIFTAPRACRIRDISILVSADITQSDTDYNTLDIQDKGSDGTGTDSLYATAPTTKSTGGLDINAFDLVSLGTPDADAILAAGDVLSFKKTHASSGQAMSDIKLAIKYICF